MPPRSGDGRGVYSPMAATWPVARLQVVEIVSVPGAAHTPGRPRARRRSRDLGGLPRGVLAGPGEHAQCGGELEVVWEVPADLGGGIAVDEQHGEADRVISGGEHTTRVVDGLGGAAAEPGGQAGQLRNCRACSDEIEADVGRGCLAGQTAQVLA